MALLFGSFVGAIGVIVLLFYILKLFSIVLFHIPGFDHVFQTVVVMVPYTLYFWAYYYLHTRFPDAKKRSSKIIARIFLVIGSLACFVTMILSLLVLFKVKYNWVKTYDRYSHISLIIQVLMIFATAAILATGDAKEKNWMDREELLDQ